MKFMTDTCKKNNCYYDTPTEEQVDTMYRKCSGDVLKLSNNKRAELFSWHTHVRNVNRAMKSANNSVSN